MKQDAAYAAEQLSRALDDFAAGRISSAFEAVRRARDAVERLREIETEEPHPENCLCRPCYETMLENVNDR